MPRRTEYGHFCMVAEALERVGDRWSLLIVRDLLLCPRRFTDLADRLGAITPKTLTVRLRELEEAGIVSSDREEGRREVWYSLTSAGRDLEPVLDALLAWGIRNYGRLPEPGEQVHPEHVTMALVRELNRSVHPKKKVTWHLRLDDTDDYTIAFEGNRWQFERGAPRSADVTIEATGQEWGEFLLTTEDGRTGGVSHVGRADEVRRFDQLLDGFPRRARSSARTASYTEH